MSSCTRRVGAVYAKKARRYFESQHIQYTDFDVEKSEKAKRAFKAMAARGVPVILVGDKRMNGFSVEGFKEIYGQ